MSQKHRTSVSHNFNESNTELIEKSHHTVGMMAHAYKGQLSEDKVLDWPMLYYEANPAYILDMLTAVELCKLTRNFFC